MKSIEVRGCLSCPYGDIDREDDVVKCLKNYKQYIGIFSYLSITYIPKWCTLNDIK